MECAPQTGGMRYTIVMIVVNVSNRASGKLPTELWESCRRSCGKAADGAAEKLPEKVDGFLSSENGQLSRSAFLTTPVKSDLGESCRKKLPDTSALELASFSGQLQFSFSDL